MNVDIRDATTVAALRPTEVTAYLRASGWHEQQRRDTWSVWMKGDEFEVIVPLSRQLHDFALRMGDVLRTLSKIEQRSQVEIFADLTTISADVIRVRASEPESADGTVSLVEGVMLVQEAMDMMAAAACAAVAPKPLYRARRPQEAADYLRGLRLGQTERGSFVVTIVSRVSPSLAGPKAPHEELFPEEPFERRVSYTLVDSLAALRSAAESAASNATFDAFANAVSEGVSANLCDAMVGMGRHLSDSGSLAVELSWARTRATRQGVVSRVAFPREFIPIFEEAARLFRERSPFEDFEIRGVVRRLDRSESADIGTATVDAPIDHRFRPVSMALAGADYQVAIQSHDRRIPMIAEGVLTKQGRSLILHNLINVRLEAVEEG
jgi:hypothetical protein